MKPDAGKPRSSAPSLHHDLTEGLRRVTGPPATSRIRFCLPSTLAHHVSALRYFTNNRLRLDFGFSMMN